MAGARTHTQARLPPAAVVAPAGILARKTLLEFSATDLSWTWLLPLLLAPAVAYVGQERPLWLPVLYVCVAVAVCRPGARDRELHPPRTA